MHVSRCESAKKQAQSIEGKSLTLSKTFQTAFPPQLSLVLASDHTAPGLSSKLKLYLRAFDASLWDIDACPKKQQVASLATVARGLLFERRVDKLESPIEQVIIYVLHVPWSHVMSVADNC